MLSAEALELIQDTARKAAGATILRIPGNHAQAYVVCDGAATVVELPRADISHNFETLGSLAAYLKSHSAEEISVFVDEEGIAAILDPDRMRDRVFLTLLFSEQFDALRELDLGNGTGTVFTQKQLVHFLRKMPAAFPDSFLTSIRQMEFKRRSDGSGTVEHGRESLGRSVEAQAQGLSGIPEYVIATVPVFQNSCFPAIAAVRCAVTIDPQNETFELEPLPGEIAEAVEQGLADVRDRTADVLPTIEVYQGTPTSLD